ncbi:MAG: hydrogenase maturation nickel metallochaperone HypA [Thermoflexales bacterium]|nr:hydrogenase maturation nickel metallochaperone HypA [Thermoflexales bacterium]MCS7324987.1 hydrogenase maturation nickel metallochaperone HypA [Thermoflexales bacterium]MCX7938670.1 hydrogenase maturation nickel metallochaperone HypA [Thermoflexales bacterium]MDW8053871.1 hydrogenase maturation nickel metallochaperone HypA [Anaerolineae bacterium]MDW8292402.1 hydrogenase maturation nickel metallochaperone HypA [Anaerolineae bacterium]
MHELSIAQSLVDAVAEAATQAGAQRVAAVHLRLGALAGVEKEALLFCYDVATRGTPLEGSALIIEDVPLVITCEACGARSAIPINRGFACPACGKLHTRIVQGKELEIASIEVEVETPEEVADVEDTPA